MYKQCKPALVLKEKNIATTYKKRRSLLNDLKLNWKAMMSYGFKYFFI